MSLNTYPMILWGDAADLSASPWGDYLGTPVVTGGVTDPFGGTSAYTINDTSGANSAQRGRPITLTMNGTQWVVVFVKAGTAAASSVAIYDNTAGVFRHRVYFTWSGASYTATTDVGNGTILTPVNCGNGWWCQIFSATGAIAANSNHLAIWPAGASNSDTGTTSFYMRNAVLLDLVDDYRRFPRPRVGYATVTGGSGVRDAWSQGTEYVRQMTARWVPASARNTPTVVSGFQGPAEATGINTSVEAMVLAGMDMGTTRWVPDRSTATTWQDCYLVSPGEGWSPNIEPNGDLAFPVELVSASAPNAVP